MKQRPHVRFPVASRSAWAVAAAGVLSAALFSSAVHAQDKDFSPEKLAWKEGPTTAKLGKVAQIELPKGFQALGPKDTRQLLEALENPTSGAELGLVAPSSGDDEWFVVFMFDEVGYVEDKEKDSLDAEAMLKTIRASSKEGNKERKKRGWPTLEVIGWTTKPQYDPETQNLEWAVEFESQGHPVVNHNTRLLGRYGVMEVSLVADPADLPSALPEFKHLLKGYSFTSGNRYAEFESGDKIASYGLAALVTGGAAAVALKTGVLQKFWKLIVLGGIAVLAGMKRFFGRLFGRSSPAGR